jgi:hypothetical protein
LLDTHTFVENNCLSSAAAAIVGSQVECDLCADGASGSVNNLLTTLITDERDAFLVPIPQYPLYSALLTLLGGTMLPYYLDELHNWSINVRELEQVITQAQDRGLRIRGMVVINPGNPTGQVLDVGNQVRDVTDLKRRRVRAALIMVSGLAKRLPVKEGVRDPSLLGGISLQFSTRHCPWPGQQIECWGQLQVELLKLCASAGIPIIADEVYQDNIWDDRKSFTSFRKVALDEKVPGAALFSLHSISKGFFGECGHRGGYLDVLNIPETIITQMKKLMSISLCSNTVGQLMVAAMMAPPKEGDASYPLFAQERDSILASMKRRAAKLVASLRALEGVTCVFSFLLSVQRKVQQATSPVAAEHSEIGDNVDNLFIVGVLVISLMYACRQMYACGCTDTFHGKGNADSCNDMRCACRL